MGARNGSNAYNNGGHTTAVTTNGAKISIKVANKAKAQAYGISEMKNKDMAKELQQAISRYAAAVGIEERNIKLAPISGAYGVTYVGANGTFGIILNSNYFDKPKAEFEKEYAKSNYARRHGFKNTTRKPAQHTLTHELAHSTWTSNFQNPQYKAAGKDIKALYKTFMNDKSQSRKKNYGSYGNTSVDEFWAEIVTRSIHGVSKDKYTRAAKSIIKKHKLGTIRATSLGASPFGKK